MHTSMQWSLRVHIRIWTEPVKDKLYDVLHHTDGNCKSRWCHLIKTDPTGLMVGMWFVQCLTIPARLLDALAGCKHRAAFSLFLRVGEWHERNKTKALFTHTTAVFFSHHLPFPSPTDLLHREWAEVEGCVQWTLPGYTWRRWNANSSDGTNGISASAATTKLTGCWDLNFVWPGPVFPLPWCIQTMFYKGKMFKVVHQSHCGKCLHSAMRT